MDRCSYSSTSSELIVSANSRHLSHTHAHTHTRVTGPHPTARIQFSDLKITKTTTPKTKPADKTALGFGSVFTDHMLSVRALQLRDHSFDSLPFRGTFDSWLCCGWPTSPPLTITTHQQRRLTMVTGELERKRWLGSACDRTVSEPVAVTRLDRIPLRARVFRGNEGLQGTCVHMLS